MELSKQSLEEIETPVTEKNTATGEPYTRRIPINLTIPRSRSNTTTNDTATKSQYKGRYTAMRQNDSIDLKTLEAEIACIEMDIKEGRFQQLQEHVQFTKNVVTETNELSSSQLVQLACGLSKSERIYEKLLQYYAAAMRFPIDNYMGWDTKVISSIFMDMASLTNEVIDNYNGQLNEVTRICYNITAEFWVKIQNLVVDSKEGKASNWQNDQEMLISGGLNVLVHCLNRLELFDMSLGLLVVGGLHQPRANESLRGLQIQTDWMVNLARAMLGRGSFELGERAMTEALSVLEKMEAKAIVENDTATIDYIVKILQAIKNV